MPRSVRSKLYATLGKWPSNEMVRTARHFEKSGKHDWLDALEISPATEEIVRRFIFQSAKVQFFADEDLVLRTLHDTQEKKDFLRTISRQNCLMGVLAVQPSDNIDELVRYWGVGGRETYVKTLLECAKRSDARHEIPLRSLLPTFARDHLLRYRCEADHTPANCYYSAMNFLSDKPDASMNDPQSCLAELKRNYVPVTDGSRRMGDVVIFRGASNELVHACNIIATNIVFTKFANGPVEPWLLCALDEVENYLSSFQPVTKNIARRKTTSGPP